MLMNYTDMIQAQVQIEAARKVDPLLDAAEQYVRKMVSPIGLSVAIATLPMAESAAEGMQNLISRKSQVRQEVKPAWVLEEGLTVITAQEDNSRQFPWGTSPEPEYAPGLWNLILTGSGDAVQTYQLTTVRLTFNANV